MHGLMAIDAAVKQPWATSARLTKAKMSLGTAFLSTATENVRVLDAGSGLVQILDRRKAIVIWDGAHRSLNRAMIDLFSARGGTLKLMDDLTEALGFDVEFAISVSLQDLVHLERLIAEAALPLRPWDRARVASPESAAADLSLMAKCRAKLRQGGQLIYEASW